MTVMVMPLFLDSIRARQDLKVARGARQTPSGTVRRQNYNSNNLSELKGGSAAEALFLIDITSTAQFWDLYLGFRHLDRGVLTNKGILTVA